MARMPPFKRLSQPDDLVRTTGWGWTNSKALRANGGIGLADAAVKHSGDVE